MAYETEYVRTNNGRDVVRRDVATSPTVARNIINTIAGILTGLLAVRMVLALIGANMENAFAQLIYGLTNWMVYPFKMLVGVNTELINGSRFEVETLLAMLVVGLVAWAIAHIVSVTEPQDV